MVFSSPEFLFLFLPIVIFGFTLTQRYLSQISSAWLLSASLIFYGWFDWAFVPLIAGSCVFNYLVGYQLSNRILKSQVRLKKTLLITGLTTNLILLGWFKYAGFLATAINAALDINVPVPHILLPLAISFFTFQQIAYLVDSYNGQIRESNFLNYCLFVMFFPQLIAGPIVHHSQMVPQYRQLPNQGLASNGQVMTGLVLIAIGLFKKIVIADTIASTIDPAFERVGDLTMIDAWSAAIGYSLQIYFDFSGYCEIAMGLALLFGLKLPVNFNSPYRSRNVSEFWRRWHITLGKFLKDYLYIPLGGNQHGMRRMYAALMITMLLGGLWHGAGWQFILWGALHGLYLVIYHCWRKAGLTLPHTLSVCLTLLVVVIAWVPFRAADLNDTLVLWKAMFSPLAYEHLPMVAAVLSDVTGASLQGVKTVFDGWELFIYLLLLVFCAKQPNVHQYLQGFKPCTKSLLITAGAACLALAMMGRPSAFIYFNF